MSDSGGAYDASEVDERPRSSHLSRKDVRVLSAVLLALVLLMMPVYCVLKIQRDKHVCKQNMGHIFKAMGVYAADNNDRFPPLFVASPSGEPQLFDAKGNPSDSGTYVYSWMTLIQPGMSTRGSFSCPAAQDEEHVQNLNHESGKEPFESDYGMYLPWSAYNNEMVSNQDRSVLFGETSNHGGNDTFDPKPFSHRQDGMVIGWDTGNDKPSTLTEYVSRLAFPETKTGKFTKDGRTRHGDSSLFITVSGQLVYLKPDSARMKWLDSAKTEPTGLWATR